MTPVSGPVRTAFRLAELRFAPRSRQDFEAELKSKVPAQVRRGEMMLKALDAGKKLDRLDYPLQAVQVRKHPDPARAGRRGDRRLRTARAA